MGFISYWPLAFLLLIPIIIILYILRQETKPRQFSSTMLWQETVKNIEATKPWERLKKNLLLFLQIITVLLLVLAMMGPWLKNVGKGQSQIVLVIDNSASMAANYSEGESRLEAAKAAACSYIDKVSSNTAIYIISGNQSAVLELANSTDHIEAKKVIKDIGQTFLPGDMSASLGLVTSCSSQYENPQIVFFTDCAFDLGDMEASVASFYSEEADFSLDSISYGAKADGLEVLLQVTNHSQAITRREINIYGIDADGKKKMLDIAEIDLDSEQVAATYVEIPYEKLEGITAIEGEINEGDMLSENNISFCVLGESKEKSVLLLSESNMFVEKAFSNLPGVDISRTDDLSVLSGEKKYDLYIIDGIKVENLPDSGSYLFINSEYQDISKVASLVKSSMLELLDTDITEYVAGSKIGVNEASVYELPKWAETYISCKDGAVGYYGIYDGHKIATIGFDIHQSDFGLQAEFPVLISNLSDYLLAGALTEKNIYTSGESLLLHGSTAGDELTIKRPDGSSKTISAAEALGSYIQVDEPGVYSVSQKLKEDYRFQQFAVNFPTAKESVVESPASMITEGGKVVSAEVSTGVLELRNIILIILMIMLILEWAVYLYWR